MDKTKAIALTSLLGITSLTGAYELGQQTAPAVDCKNQVCVVEVDNRKPGYHSNSKYTAEEWNTKTDAEVQVDLDTNYSNWKKIVEEQSKKIKIDEENL